MRIYQNIAKHLIQMSRSFFQFVKYFDQKIDFKKLELIKDK